jgi:hypothetical protein
MLAEMVCIVALHHCRYAHQHKKPARYLPKGRVASVWAPTCSNNRQDMIDKEWMPVFRNGHAPQKVEDGTRITPMALANLSSFAIIISCLN